MLSLIKEWTLSVNLHLNNIKVSKSSSDSKTRSQSVKLEGLELYSEIARLMGTSLDEKGLAVSKDLKEKCDKYKQSIN